MAPTMYFPLTPNAISEANDAPERWRTNPRLQLPDQQHPPVRDPHEAQETTKLPHGLAQQVPLQGQEDRCPLPRYFSCDLCIL